MLRCFTRVSQPGFQRNKLDRVFPLSEIGHGVALFDADVGKARERTVQQAQKCIEDELIY